MGERVRYGLVSLVQADGWLRTRPETFGASPARLPDYLLRSARGDGRFQIATVAMPEDMGSFDLTRLEKLVERPLRSPVPLSFFDEVTWEENGIAGVARSTVSTPHPDVAPRLREATSLMRFREEQRAELERYLAAPTVRREWFLACGVEMAKVWYRGASHDAVAADLADCEEMVRSILFDSG